MHRLFVAIRPPRPIREQLLGLMQGIPNARWQEDEQLHLTLRFIGEVDRHQAEDVAAALGGIHPPAFDLRISGVGCFDRRGKGAIWAGLDPVEPLKSLHKKVDQACIRAGVPAGGRAFHPHITLARTGRDTGLLGPFLQRWSSLSSADFTVADFRLFESRLSSDGASYTTVAMYRLQPRSTQTPS